MRLDIGADGDLGTHGYRVRAQLEISTGDRSELTDQGF